MPWAKAICDRHRSQRAPLRGKCNNGNCLVAGERDHLLTGLPQHAAGTNLFTGSAETW